MKRLFFQFFIRILVALIISVVVAFLAIRLIGPDRYLAKQAQALLKQMYYVENHLSRLSEHEITLELDRIKATMPQLQERVEIVKSTDPLLPESARTVLDQNRIFFHSSGKGIRIYKRIHKGRYVLVYGPIYPPPPFDILSICIALAIILPIVAAAGYLLARPIFKNLKALEEVTLKFGKGNLDTRANISSSDSLGELALGFNQMAKRIQRLINDQKYLLQAVSHEFRQPLSRIRFNLALLYKADSPEARHQRIAKMEKELEELGALLKELILYMSMETDFQKPEKKSLPVYTILNELVQKRLFLRPEIKITINSTSKDEIFLNTKEIHFKRAIGNLLNNAVVAAKSKITLDVSMNDECIHICVTDDGDGIPPDERKRVFKPFVRLDDSRSRDFGGMGLGLAIVYRIMEFHGGSVDIIDTEDKGAKFITIWPLP